MNKLIAIEMKIDKISNLFPLHEKAPLAVLLVILIAAAISLLMVFAIIAVLMAIAYYRRSKLKKKAEESMTATVDLDSKIKFAQDLLQQSDKNSSGSEKVRVSSGTEKSANIDSGEGDRRQVFVAGGGGGGLFSELFVGNLDDAQIFYAQYPFDPRTGGELGLKVGDTVYVVDRSDPTWWIGFVDDGKYQEIFRNTIVFQK